MVQLTLNFAHASAYTHVSRFFLHVTAQILTCTFLVVHEFFVQFNTPATLDISHKNRLVTSVCLFSQQTHEACNTSRVHISSTSQLATYMWHTKNE